MNPLLRRTLLRSSLAGAIYHWLPVARAQSGLGHRRKRPIDNSPAPMPDSANGPIVVLIHGALADMGFWQPLIALLTEYCSVISYTLYGHYTYHNGRDLTPHAPRDDSYALQRHANDLLALIDQVGVGPAHLVGHDLGSNIALQTALTRPDWVASLMLCNSSPVGLPSDDADVRVAVDHDCAILQQARRAWSAGDAKQAMALFLQNYVGSDGAPTPDWVRAMYAQNLSTLPLLVDLHLRSPVITAAEFHRINMPMNLLSSATTRASARAGNDLLANRFKQATHSLIAGGYLAPIAAPRQFSHAMQTFLNPAGATASLLRT